MLSLDSGELWAFADKGAAGFEIKTPHTLSTITGTVFGISAAGGKDTISVLRGKIRVNAGEQTIMVTRRQAYTIAPDPASADGVQLSKTTVTPPQWAIDLLTSYQQHHFLRYFPSVSE
jgi:hypothetical protein